MAFNGHFFTVAAINILYFMPFLTITQGLSVCFSCPRLPPFACSSGNARTTIAVFSTARVCKSQARGSASETSESINEPSENAGAGYVILTSLTPTLLCQTRLSPHPMDDGYPAVQCCCYCTFPSGPAAETVVRTGTFLSP